MASGHHLKDKRGNHRAAGAHIVGKIRGKISAALDILDDTNRNIENILADQFEADPAGTLQKLGKFMPQDVNNDNSGEIVIIRKEYVVDGDSVTARDAPPVEPATVPDANMAGSSQRH